MKERARPFARQPLNRVRFPRASLIATEHGITCVAEVDETADYLSVAPRVDTRDRERIQRRGDRRSLPELPPLRPGSRGALCSAINPSVVPERIVVHTFRRYRGTNIPYR